MNRATTAIVVILAGLALWLVADHEKRLDKLESGAAEVHSWTDRQAAWDSALRSKVRECANSNYDFGAFRQCLSSTLEHSPYPL